ncbi:MAG: nitrogenase cofactor biosynthesis protein NifB [Rhodospirillaceae bacterium]
MSQTVVSLEDITGLNETEALRKDIAAGSGSGCSSKGSCGADAGPDDMPQEVWNKVKDHPCYSEEAHHYFARMHVAVAPACNIQCNYCNRKYDCANESRPGVVSERLTPEQAVRKVVAVSNEVPQLSVLGIAGPGDSLFDWRKTFKTFELVEKHLPDLSFCVSTNGLALPDHVDELANHNIDHVTITLNMIDPEIGTAIYPWVYYEGKRWTGLDASKILHERQMEGLEALVSKNILVKVNSVMIPGVNDEHLKEVNKVVREKGAFLHNVMPLISEAEHGTHFGLTGQRGPSPSELKDLQDELGGGANLMKHCRQCRADAVGLLGEDRGQEFTMDKLPEEIVVDASKREEYRTIVEQERADRRIAKEEALDELASLKAAATPSRLVAICTKGGGRINLHFGKVKEFQIYEVDAEGVRFVGHRKVPENYCLGGFNSDTAMEPIIEILDGIHSILSVKCGNKPRKALEAAGYEVCEDYKLEYIEPAITAWYRKWAGLEDVVEEVASVSA